MRIGTHHTEETRRKVSIIMKKNYKGMSGKHHSEETKKKIGNKNRGKHRTVETRRKMSETHKGKCLNEETRKKISEAKKGKNNPMYGVSSPMKGKHHSIESKRKIGIVHIGKPLSKEHKKKIGEANKGHLTSEETKRKISNANSGENNWNYGNHWTEEQRKKSSGKNASMYGKHHSEETKKKMSLLMIGKNNPNYGKHLLKKTKIKMSASTQGISLNEWNGFISFKPYTLDFNGLFKKLIRKRDNNSCMICNKPQEKFKKSLDIHHIDYNKLNSFPQNCISLCKSCHSKTNINRNQWTTFFQSLLKERYGYQYTQDQKIILDFVGN